MEPATKVAVIHDLSGFGRCSLTVVLPVLAAMGSQCCPIPTAYLSAHTAFPPSPHAVFMDMTDQMQAVGGHWRQLGVSFDAIYSGFLGSALQIKLLRELITQFRKPQTVVLVDPVMGDHGKPYHTYTPDMCQCMGELALDADIITPNLTEAALLLGEVYTPSPGEDSIRSWLERLSLHGRRSVVITGVSLAAGQLGAACLDRTSGQIDFAMAQEEPCQFPGTGDLFASVLLGAMLRGKPLAEATAQAVRFVQRCAHHTLALQTPVLEGVQFETLLRELS